MFVCGSECDTEDRSWDELPATADWGYLRLRREDYSEEDVDRWADTEDDGESAVVAAMLELWPRVMA